MQGNEVAIYRHDTEMTAEVGVDHNGVSLAVDGELVGFLDPDSARRLAAILLAAAEEV